jgi:hypothetical protein
MHGLGDSPRRQRQKREREGGGQLVQHWTPGAYLLFAAARRIAALLSHVSTSATPRVGRSRQHPALRLCNDG